MKKGLKIVVLALSVALLFASCGKNDGAGKKKNFILATGGTSGTYYPFGGAIANIWTFH